MYVILGQFAALLAYAIAPLIGFFLLVASLAFQLFFVFQFCTATFPREQGVILGILSLVPLLGLVVLLVVNSSATKILKANGVPVGFIGVSDAAIQELQMRNKK